MATAKPLNVIGVLVKPLQNAKLLTALTVGVGYTIILKLPAVTVQEFAVAETVIVAVSITLVVLVAVKAGILPMLLLNKPMAVKLLFQLKLVPLTVPLKLIKLVDAPLQII